MFAEDAKSWQSKFLQVHVYQTKNITPYMHAFVAHVPEFLKIHGAIAPYTQQGLEKLNDSLTQFFLPWQQSQTHTSFKANASEGKSPCTSIRTWLSEG